MSATNANEGGRVTIAEGAARFFRKVKKRTAWANPEVREYEPNWMVMFTVCGESWTETAKRCPVAMGPKPVIAWAKEEIKTQAYLLQQGERDEAKARREKPRTVSLAALLVEYRRNVPPGKPDYAKNAQRLRAICEEITGMDADDIAVTDELLNRRALFDWVRMRQEFARRGWTVRGEAPEDAWQQLREDLKAGRLPGIDKTTVAEGNTTILTYLRCAKAVFANHREYLGALVLPELREFLQFSVDIRAPKGHREIPADVAARIWTDAETLKDENVHLWALLQVLAWTGARPAQVVGMTGAALEMQADGTGVVLVPVAKGGRPVRWPVAEDVAQALEMIRTESSLLGAGSPTAAHKMHRALNGWLRERGVEGTHAAYLLRHARGQQLREAFGVERAADGLGHTSTAMVQAVYTQAVNVMPMLDPRPTVGRL